LIKTTRFGLKWKIGTNICRSYEAPRFFETHGLLTERVDGAKSWPVSNFLLKYRTCRAIFKDKLAGMAMANTYTQLYAHVVFAVRGRAHLIAPQWKEELYKYITGIISHKNQKLMVINGMPDHLHLLIDFIPIAPCPI
jgi:hypothetical protein